MGELSKALAMEDEFEHDGKKYRFSPLTLEVQAAWESWFELRSRLKLEEQRKHLPPGVYEERAKALEEAIDAGERGFFSETASRALSPLSSAGILGPGYRQLLFIRIQRNHPDADEKVIWNIVETQFMKLIELAQAKDKLNPNSQSPEKAGAGSESQPPSPASSTEENPSTK